LSPRSKAMRLAYRRFLERAATLGARLCAAAHGGQLDPEDIVQETLLAVHLKRHTWRTDAAVEPWLYAIARYKLIDAFRRAGRRIEIDISELADVLPAQSR
jgi:RNA polymerase sigma-70 factor (ECF subfamily)